MQQKTGEKRHNHRRLWHYIHNLASPQSLKTPAKPTIPRAETARTVEDG
jgi:hypothetical protein